MVSKKYRAQYAITADEIKKGVGRRLDKFLAERLSDLSRSYIQKLIAGGEITVRNCKVDKSYRLQEGDHILINIPAPRTVDLTPEKMELDIIHEDKEILVLNKPAGLVVHPDKHHQKGTLVHGLLYHISDLPAINGVYRPGIVHRLDKDTSGVLVTAKTENSMCCLLSQFEERKVKKVYRALVWGQVPHKKGKIKAPIGRDPDHRTRMKVRKENSREAVTHFEVLEIYHDFSYLELVLETGRTHQARVHLDFMGYPVVGDEKYNQCQQGKVTEIRGEKINRHLLHAFQLGFYHPGHQEFVSYEAPLPEIFQKMIDSSGKTG